MRTQACAIGQAAAALFAQAAVGLGEAEIGEADEALGAWLSGDGDMPPWPGLATIAPALAYPARHGAIRLGWRAAREALSLARAQG